MIQKLAAASGTNPWRREREDSRIAPERKRRNVFEFRGCPANIRACLAAVGRGPGEQI